MMTNKEILKQKLNSVVMNGGLAAKWMERQGPVAAEIRKHFGMSPKFYRKSLVELTDVVEQKMCAKEWDEINFSHVPSIAASRYRKAFGKNAPSLYAAYVAQLVAGDNPDVKINASAIFPHEVLKGGLDTSNILTDQQKAVAQAQWNALPNYMDHGLVLPVVDVSSSMTCPAGRSGSVTCRDISVSLGLYCADKNKGPFNGMFLTFCGTSQLTHLTGSIWEKISQMHAAGHDWGTSTSIERAFLEILRVGKAGNVPDADMPKVILIMSDMQFNGCVSKKDSLPACEAMFRAACYTPPKVVFWNLNNSGSVPVAFDKSGVALVSGFSPSILKPVLSADFDNFTPEAIMKNALMIERYDL